VPELQPEFVRFINFISKVRSMEKINRVPIGIPSVDQLISGGIPKGSIILLSGACGTGKSTFAMQFLYEGAKFMGEPGVYVTLEEDPKNVVQNMGMFGWDVEGLIAAKKLLVIKPDVYKFDSIKQIIEDAIEKIGAKRLVVDSYSVMLTYLKDPYEIRNGLVQLDREIKKMNCTALVISDIKDDSEIFSTTGVEEFIVDGVIVLYLVKGQAGGAHTREISVRKMRATNHSLQARRFEITQKGIEIAGGKRSARKKAVGMRAPKNAASRPSKKGGEPPKTAPGKMIDVLKAGKMIDVLKAGKMIDVLKAGKMVDVGSLRARGRTRFGWKHL